MDRTSVTPGQRCVQAIGLSGFATLVRLCGHAGAGIAFPVGDAQSARQSSHIQQGDPMKYTRLILLSAMVAACSTDQDSSRQFPLSPNLDQSTNVVGQVYTMSNATAGNSVLVFDRAADGSL